MTEIRTLIVDDEPLARRGIRQLLAPYADFTVVGECRDGREALRALTTLSPDLVFLDIQMPGLDGLAVVRLHGAEQMPATVFVTAYDDFAVQAFETHALDYLVKPLVEARFRATIARVRQRVRAADALLLARRLSAALDTLAPGSGNVAATPSPRSGGREGGREGGRIAVLSNDGEVFLAPRDIDWIAADDYQAIVHAAGRRYRVRESLAEFERQLDAAQFVRIHRSAIVRLDRIRELRLPGAGRHEARIVLHDTTQLTVSRRRLARLRALLRAGRVRS